MRTIKKIYIKQMSHVCTVAYQSSNRPTWSMWCRTYSHISEG